jgi:hypothetical protein
VTLGASKLCFKSEVVISKSSSVTLVRVGDSSLVYSASLIELRPSDCIKNSLKPLEHITTMVKLSMEPFKAARCMAASTMRPVRS